MRSMKFKLLTVLIILAASLSQHSLRAPFVRSETKGQWLDAEPGLLFAKRPVKRKKAPVPAPEIKITVLFFNDLHGNLMPFKVKKDDGSMADVGGIASIAALVKDIREKNARKGVRTFILVAGDMLQGTPLSTVFQGKPDVEIFNAMGVSVMTVGNHEFDFGLNNFLNLKKMAKFPIISSNIIWKDTRERMNPESASFPLSKDITLTVVGATTNELLTTTAPSNVEKVDVLDSIQTVTAAYEAARDRGPVILLSHSKFQADSDVARAIPGLTAIIGGHDQVLFDPFKIASGVPVFQAYEKGRYLGRLDLSVNMKTRRAIITKSAYIPITTALRPDPEISRILAGYNAKLDTKFKETVGEALVFLDGERGRIRYEETNLGNFVADVMREHTNARAAFINAGALRASINKGPVTIEDVFRVMPYSNELLVVTLTGAEIAEALARSVQGTRADEDGGFLHVSGVTFKVQAAKVSGIVIGGEPLDPAKSYTVAMTDFMYSGGDGYRVFMNRPALKTGLPLRELLVDTIRKKSKVEAKIEGRIIRAE